MKKIRHPYRNAFWEKLPARAYFIFILSVFFSFSIFGFADDLLQNLSVPIPLVFFWALYCGAIAVGYAYSFTRNFRALAYVIIIQVALMFVPVDRIFQFPNVPNQHTKLLFDAIGIYLGVILGYIFFIIFITHEGIKQIQLKTEVDLAAGMHEVLVPPLDFKNDSFEVYGKSLPAMEIGGDLIDIYKNDNYLTAYVADVSGHGIDAGLLMGMFKSAVHSWFSSGVPLTNLIKQTNNTLIKLKKPNMFITCSFIRFYPNSSVEYLTAGHLPVLHLTKDSNNINHLLVKQIPVAVKENYDFLSQIINYSPGDIFVLLTDGIVEVMDKNTELFGLENVEKILKENHSQSARQIFENILKEVNKYGKKMDDQSLVIIKSLA